MGASGSAPTTPMPGPLRNRHLAHVSDPRSPSAGILRTPIEVVSSPAGSPQPGPAQAGAQDADPRSPTPGISRTPMKDTQSDSVECLVRQLGEVFAVDTAPPEPPPPAAERACEEPALRGAAELQPDRGPEPGCEATLRPHRCAGPGLASVNKHARRKASNKILATSGGIVRSPFSILQDDNSPSAPVQRQVKKHILGENPGEKDVAVDLSRNLKAGNCAWSDLNKENQQCPFVEN
ncbi:cell division cycle-associated protein 3 [Lagopus leucura]|uniref:cell division cycle-associated protein 3 n=1 Tax=Lagopus leucura TaxID=30410 RepID=UPI001C66EB7A|nr:cell division cycle-associated protein 3 [Lagopus leucura]